MGKWGGRELNYSSDIDVLFVYDVPPDCDPAVARDYAARVAAQFIALLADITSDGIAYRVDADLRPEGKNGPLARSLDSYRAYYERWAETWEFQALLKARPVAGDRELGERFLALVEPFVYPDTLDSEAVRTVRHTKSRLENRAARPGAAMDVKRGSGGIRDVEFPVQLLQLVHGRFDTGLRTPNTLELLAALDEFGYVRSEDAAALADSYRWLRDLEHRIQLFDLRQTHELPADRRARERIAKAMGYRDDAEATALDRFEEDLVAHRSMVRGIHQRLFYRPLLEAFAASPTVRLSEEGVGRQLAALGFRDVDGARRAFDDLTAGLSRRSNLMQQMLPLMMEWLSDAPNPDLGLEQLRLLVTTTTDNARLIATLRDAPVAAERLCRMLGTSRWLGQLLDRIPEFLARLGDDHALAEVPLPADLSAEAADYVLLRPDYASRLLSIRRFVRRHLLRIAGRDLLGPGDVVEVGHRLSAVADAAAAVALVVAEEELRGQRRFADSPPIPFSIVAMGKWGGRELHYASDLDVLFVYGPAATGDADAAREYAQRLAAGFIAAMSEVTAEGPAFRVDPDLRPEGKGGPLVRSLDSYGAYYERWAETWEFQALTRARHVAGDAELGNAFSALVAPFVYPDRLSGEAVRAVRQMKARIEKERLPPGEDPDFHLKLGPGGLVDVEFLVQLLQLQHGGRQPSLRAPNTLEALHAIVAAGLLEAGDGAVLERAHRFCSRVRNRLYLQTGKPVDALPADPDEVTRLALSLGYESAPRSSLREEYRRVTRRARRIIEARFYRDG